MARRVLSSIPEEDHRLRCIKLHRPIDDTVIADFAVDVRLSTGHATGLVPNIRSGMHYIVGSLLLVYFELLADSLM